MQKPEIRFGKNDIRYCRYCEDWDANVYEEDAKGRKRLVHEGVGCIFGTESCPYAEDTEFPPLKPKYEICTGCPYGVGKPCIGWCTAKILGQIEGDPDVI